MGMNVFVSTKGMKDFSKLTENQIAELEQKVDEAVERRALLMVNDTKASAPVDTGKLRNSIDIIPQETKPMQRSYGTNVEYAIVQEYEHKTKKGFFRNNITKHEPLLKSDIRKALRGG
jgi:ABC-type phosphate transport system ATPase subunit